MNDEMEELPEGWVRTTIGELLKPSAERIEPSEQPDAPYLSLEHIESDTGRIIKYGKGSDVNSTKAVFRAGDVLYGKLRPYLNKVTIPDRYGICSTDILVFQENLLLDSSYLRHFLSTPTVVEFANHHSTGVQLPRISFGKLSELDFPLPPLAEQKRIVAKVEALLADVNAARQRLAKAPTLLKRFRQAVLAAACSGRLTEDWRGEDSLESQTLTSLRVEHQKIESLLTEELLPEDWLWVRFGDLVTELRNGISIRPNQELPGNPILRINAVRPGKVFFDDLRYLPDSDDTIPVYSLRDGDLLFTRYNGSLELLGVCGMVSNLNGRILLYPDKLMRVRFEHDLVLPRFCELFFASSAARERMIANSKSSAGQNGISGSDVKAQPFSLPPFPEQHEIVRRVDALFQLADRMEAKVKAATARAAKLTQAILAKAFRGELVPTEAELARQEGRDYEPASVLLERIEGERAAEKPAKGKRSKGRKAER